MIKHDNKNEPPADINGIGKPFTGINPIVIAELIKICDNKIEDSPIITNPLK